jgi:hypothetical protein
MGVSIVEPVLSSRINKTWLFKRWICTMKMFLNNHSQVCSETLDTEDLLKSRNLYNWPLLTKIKVLKNRFFNKTRIMKFLRWNVILNSTLHTKELHLRSHNSNSYPNSSNIDLSLNIIISP